MPTGRGQLPYKMTADKAEKSQDPAIEEVMLQERARGRKRKPPDADIVQARKERQAGMRVLFRTQNRKEFLRMLTERHGLRVGSEQYNDALQAWNEYQRQRFQKP